MKWLHKFFARRPAPEAPTENGMATNYMVNIAYDEAKHDWCARIISYEDRQTRWLRKTSLDWLLFDVKHEIMRHQHALRHNPNESRIIVPLNGSRAS